MQGLAFFSLTSGSSSNPWPIDPWRAIEKRRDHINVAQAAYESRSGAIKTLTPLQTQVGSQWGGRAWPSWPLGLGLALFILPTLYDVALYSWSTEQGAHGPIVLATGIWLLTRELRAPVRIHPGKNWLTAVALAPLLALFCLARISGILEIEAFVMYAALIVSAYYLYGSALVRRIWFPLVYLAFIFPPPNTVFAILTQPMKIFISHASVLTLQFFDYPIVNSGVSIQIGQYQMLVAAACSGLNSIISLTALGLFYSYMTSRSNAWRMAVLVVCILPIAIVANIVRVLLLLLITYHFGEAAGQGFFHELAGLTMFATALLCIFGVDRLSGAVLTRKPQHD